MSVIVFPFVITCFFFFLFLVFFILNATGFSKLMIGRWPSVYGTPDVPPHFNRPPQLIIHADGIGREITNGRPSINVTEFFFLFFFFTEFRFRGRPSFGATLLVQVYSGYLVFLYRVWSIDPIEPPVTLQKAAAYYLEKKNQKNRK